MTSLILYRFPTMRKLDEHHMATIWQVLFEKKKQNEKNILWNWSTMYESKSQINFLQQKNEKRKFCPTENCAFNWLFIMQMMHAVRKILQGKITKKRVEYQPLIHTISERLTRWWGTASTVMQTYQNCSLHSEAFLLSKVWRKTFSLKNRKKMQLFKSNITYCW